MPKIAIISDVHGNLPALEKVVAFLEKKAPDKWICLGDLTGYGPSPSEVIEVIRSYNMICVKGNHDAGVTGELTDKHFRNPNRKLIQLSKKLVTEDQMIWLKKCEFVIEEDEWVASHASPVKPQKWEYVESAFRAREILNNIKQKYCFIGHTHRPSIVSNSFGIIGSKKIKENLKYMINPGSVGQSRDSDFRASCALLDTDNLIFENFRIDYEIEPVLVDIEKLGFSRKEALQLMRINN